MIRLLTGLPGHGKSLLLIEEILENRDKPDRRLIYHNIKGADHERLGTLPLENPDRWMDLPDGSMIIVDECQHWWPPRSSGSKVPEHTLALQEHRHRGFDFVFVTQHPSLIDFALRDLVERHDHCHRPYQAKYRKIFTYQGCCREPAPADKGNRTEQRKRFKSDLFQYYKSASIHTKVNKFPMQKVYGLVGALAFVGLAAWWVVTGLYDQVPVQEVVHSVAPEVETVHVAPELPSYRFSGSWVSDQQRVLWVSDVEGRTLSLGDLGGYRVIDAVTVILLDFRGRETGIVRDRQLVELLW